MDNTSVFISIGGLAVTAAGFFMARQKDAIERGKLEQKVSDLKERVDMQEKKSDKILEKLDDIQREIRGLLSDHVHNYHKEN